ncbi:unnamed protein product [Arabis nemorensis]|uniref:DUF3444 domain-containing protein n=1 Tax=Arabis nemorensis TaxID=586526 RepID=A0A565B1D2_9BRAS|nr:unnamed protein product [Arabis nemorensis]
MDRNQDAQVGAAVGNSGNLEVDKNFEDVIDRDIDNNRRGFNINGDAGRQDELGWGRQLHEVDRSDEILPNVINTNQKLNENQDDLGSSGNLEVDKNSGLCDSGSEVAVQPQISECAGLKFNNFDKRREEVEFGPWQAWALYDTADGMPRQITYLEPDPDDEKEIQWFKEESPVSAGKFRLGKNQNTKDRSMFSHVIWCNEGSKKGHFTVSPKKGQTWALFKKWDINWSSEPDSHRKFEYEFVEILSDYDDRVGVSVAFLYKAKGFASVFFRMGTGNADVFHILPQSLYRFSHRFHSFKMKRVDIKGVPKDAYELDQAALPETIEEKVVPSHLYAEPKPEALAFPNKGKVFQTGQIWSYYSGFRKITLIQAFEQEAVIKLHVGRLKATFFPENGIQWEDKRMHVDCGNFLVRKSSEVLTADDVSHQIVRQRSMDGDEYTVLPKIGQVWAIYRIWTSNKEYVGCCDYDIVEVLDDSLEYKVLALEPALFYNEDEEKKTFFRGAESRHRDCDNEDGSEVISTIPKSKMLRFSHQILASLVTREINGDTKELFEVDSRALPTNVRSRNH